MEVDIWYFGHDFAVNCRIGFSRSFHEYSMSQRRHGIIILLLSQVHLSIDNILSNRIIEIFK